MSTFSLVVETSTSRSFVFLAGKRSCRNLLGAYPLRRFVRFFFSFFLPNSRQCGVKNAAAAAKRAIGFCVFTCWPQAHLGSPRLRLPTNGVTSRRVFHLHVLAGYSSPKEKKKRRLWPLFSSSCVPSRGGEIFCIAIKKKNLFFFFEPRLI